MARPRKINPNGPTHRLMITMALPDVEKLRTKAKKRGVSVSETVRQMLEL